MDKCWYCGSRGSEREADLRAAVEDWHKTADLRGAELAAANERAGRLEELRKDAWAMLLAIASGNGPFEKKMTRADMMEAARQSAEALEVPDAL